MPGQDQDAIRASVAAAIHLHELAQVLRSTHHLGPEEQRAIAALADELGNVLEQPSTVSEATPALAERITHLAESLQHGSSGGLLQGIRQRIEEMAAKMEGSTPNAAVFARQLVDVLARLGI